MVKSLWPELGHPADEKRKADFINSLNANNETVDFNDLYDCYREVNLLKRKISRKYNIKLQI